MAGGSDDGSFMQSLRSEPFRRRVFDNNSLIEVRVTDEAEGDCMYSSIVAAMSSDNEEEESGSEKLFQVLNEPQLRGVVAKGVTDEVLKQYACDFERGMAHSEFMSGVKSLEDLRRQIEMPRLVWGDSYALAELACHLDIIFLLWSEPLVPLRRYNSGYPFVSIPAPPVSRDNKQLRYIMLQHTRREHYNLITFDQKAVFRYTDLPPIVIERWSHIWSECDGESSDNTGPREAELSASGVRRSAVKRPRNGEPAPSSTKRPKPKGSRPPKASAESAPKRVRVPKATVSRGKVAQEQASKLSKASKCGRFGHFVDCQCHIKHKLLHLKTHNGATAAQSSVGKGTKAVDGAGAAMAGSNGARVSLRATGRSRSKD